MICSDLSSLLIFNISDLLSSLEMSINRSLEMPYFYGQVLDRSCLGGFLLSDLLGYFYRLLFFLFLAGNNVVFTQLAPAPPEWDRPAHHQRLFSH